MPGSVSGNIPTSVAKSARKTSHGRDGVVGQAVEVARAFSIKDALRFTYHASASGPFKDRWLPFLKQFAETHHLAGPSVDLLMKPLNPYMSMNRKFDERIEILQVHHRLAAEVLVRRAMETLWRGENLELGRISGRSGTYGLWLCSPSAVLTRKEGEVTLALRDERNGLDLAKLTFVLVRTSEGGYGMMIGGIQGHKSPSAKQMVVAATRDLFGLRPKDAVLLAALAVAQKIGVHEVWAVPGRLHTHNARSQKHRERLHADYDAYWAERGARGDARAGWVFHVPPTPRHSGKTPSGVRRDAIKDQIWHIARRASKIQTAQTGAQVIENTPNRWALEPT